MFTVRVSDPSGQAAHRFRSPVAALDLVLVADRASLPWSVTAGPVGGSPVTLSLEALRDLAAWSARLEPAAAEHLRRVGRAELVAAVALLN